MKNLFFLLVSIIFCLHATAATDVWRRNIKLPSQDVLQKQQLTPATADDDLLSLSISLGEDAQTVSSFLAQPDVPRNLVITTANTTADVAAGNIVVTGRNSDGVEITETFALTENQNGATTGNKAFASVTSIAVPVGASPFGATVKVGTGTKLGLQKCLDGAGYLIKGLVDGVALTGTTVASSATALESNTVIPDPAPNGSRQFTLFYVQNYRCAE